MLKSVKDRLRKLLIGSQQYTGTDNIYIAKSGFWTSLPYLISTLLAVVQVIVFANILPKETYGTYKYIVATASAFGFLTLTGMNTAVTQMTARGIEGILSYSVRLQLQFNTLYAAVALMLSTYYWYHQNHPLALGLSIIGITLPITAALTTYGAYLSGKKDFQRASSYAILGNIFSSAMLILATIITRNVVVIVLGYSLGNLLPGLYFYFRTQRQSTASTPTLAEKHELATYGGHLSILNVLSTIGQYIDKIVLFHFAGAVELAVYSLAQAIPERVEGYFKSWTTILLPKLSERSTEHVAPVFYKRIAQGMVMGSVVVVGYWVAAPVAFKLLLPQYIESIQYSRIIMLSLIFTTPAAYISSVFKSQKILTLIYSSSTFGNVCLITLYATLGPLFGVWGLVWAQVIGHGLGTIFNCILWQWHLNRYRPATS